MCSKKLYSEYEFRSIFNMHNKNKELFWDRYRKLINSNKGNTIELSNCSNNLLYIPNNIKYNKKKKILIVSHELSRTGAPVVAFDTAKKLYDEGYNVIIATIYGGDLLNEILDYGIPVIILNEIKRYQYLRNDLCHFNKYYDLDILVNSCDKVIFNTATLYQLVKRYMNDYKNLYWWIHEGSSTYNVIADKMPKYINKNVKVLCVGEYASKQLDNYGFHYNQKILNYGVDDLGILNKKKHYKKVTFLNVGTIGERKGQQLLIDVIKKLPKKYFNRCEFVFIGDCSIGDKFANDIRLELLELSKKYKNIKYYAAIPREKLLSFYSKVDVLTVTSIDDPMPVVATENFMLGNVVLCSSATGTSYYLKDYENGLVFESGNEKELRKKLEYAVNNASKLVDIGENGRCVFEENFDMNIFKKNILNMIVNEKVVK